MENRTKAVTIRFTPEEWELIKKAALKAYNLELPDAVMVRECCLKTARGILKAKKHQRN